MKSFESEETAFRKYGKLIFKPDGIFQILKISIAAHMPSIAKTLGKTVIYTIIYDVIYTKIYSLNPINKKMF